MILGVIGGAILLIGILIVILGGVYWFATDDPIDFVKTGTLDLDDSVTVGDALDGYQYFGRTEWSYFETSQKRRIVEFKGYYDHDKFVGAEISGATITQEEIGNLKRHPFGPRFAYTIQFSLSKDDESFEIQYSGLEISGKNIKTGQPVSHNQNDKMELLPYIYRNELDPLIYMFVQSHQK